MAAKSFKIGPLIEEEISGTQGEAIQSFQRLKVKSVAFEDDGTKITGTLVEATSLVIDEEKLRKKVGAKTWQRITKRALDRSLLEAAVAEGLITPTTVASCAEEKKNNPYIRITEKR